MGPQTKISAILPACKGLTGQEVVVIMNESRWFVDKNPALQLQMLQKCDIYPVKNP